MIQQRFPEVSGEEYTLDRPITSVSLDADGVDVIRTISVVINGVDAGRWLGGKQNGAIPAHTTLDTALLYGDYDVCVAQSVTDGTNSFYYGEKWTSSAKYLGSVPLKYLPYRQHENLFVDATDKINSMDRMWREHSDTNVIKSMLEAYREQAIDFVYRQIQTSARSSILYADSAERRRIAFVTFNGAIGPEVPYLDVPALYEVAKNGTKVYLYGYDYLINDSGIPVFLNKNAPGRIKSVYIERTETFTRNPGSGYESAVTVPLTDGKQFCLFTGESSQVIGVDFFIKPPQEIGESILDDSQKIGIISLTLPNGQKVELYNPSKNVEALSGSILLENPVDFNQNNSIFITEDRLAVGLKNNTFPVNVTLWLNKSVTLIGPEYHLESDGVACQLMEVAGIKITGPRHTHRVKAAAIMMARTEKSLEAYETLVESLLELPISPVNGPVTRISAANPGDFCGTQIDVTGWVFETHLPVEFSVSEGDRVSFLQRLVDRDADGVKIDDLDSNPSFLDGDDALVYINSKIVTADAPPTEFQVSGFSQVDYAREMLKPTSFRVSLGEYASYQFATQDGFADKIFEALDKFKPSGTDYWIRLFNGTGIVRTTPKTIEVDLSSHLELETDYGHRIYDSEPFSISQCDTLSLRYSGGTPRVGDQITVKFYVSTTSPTSATITETLLSSDFVSNPLYPVDEVFKRIVSQYNSSADPAIVEFSTNLEAVLVEGGADEKITFVIRESALSSQTIDAFKEVGLATVSINQTGGAGLILVSPTALSRAVPGDTSRRFITNQEAIDAMNSYRQLDIHDNGGNVPPVDDADISDTGDGAFDDSKYTITTAPTTIYLKADTYDNAQGSVIGRLGLDLVIAAGMQDEQSAFISFSPASPATPVTVTATFVPDASLGLAASYVLSYTTVTGESAEAALSRIGGDVIRHSILAQYWKARYAPTLSSGYNIEIYPIDVTKAYLWTITFAAIDQFAVAVPLDVNGNIGSPYTFEPPICSIPQISAVYKYNAGADLFTPQPEEVFTVPFYDLVTGASLMKIVDKFSRVSIPATSLDPVDITIELTYSVGTPPESIDFPLRAVVDPIIDVYSIKLTVNDYPEFSHDDDESADMITFEDFSIKNQGFPVSTGDPTPVCADMPIQIDEAVTEFYHLNDDISSSMTGLYEFGARDPRDIRRNYANFCYAPIFTSGAISDGATLTIKQNVCGVGDETVTCVESGSLLLYNDFYYGSTFLFAEMTDGSLQLLKTNSAPTAPFAAPQYASVDYDYTEVAGDTFTQITLANPIPVTSPLLDPDFSRVVGYALSADWYRYYYGPTALTSRYEEIKEYNLAIFVLQEPYDFILGAPRSESAAKTRAANMKVYDPSYDYSVNPLPTRKQWKDSVASKHQAFRLDDDVIYMGDDLTIE